MQIWVDADACPSAIREVIAKAAHKRTITATFVANHGFSLPNSPFVKLYQVPSGFDEADKEIERRVTEGDLVITSDIPLASDVIEKAAAANGYSYENSILEIAGVCENCRN